MTWETVVVAEASGTDFYEPWRPEAGQRVRVHLSAECQFEYPLEFEGARRVYHWPQLDGAVGVVMGGHGCDPLHVHTSHDPSHRYLVKFDDYVLIEGGPSPHWCVSQCFAALELEPV